MSSNVLNRLTSIYPIECEELFNLYQKAKSMFWTEDEIDMSNDLTDWINKLNDNERKFISHILGFFVQADQLVNINLGDRFLQDIDTIPSKYGKYARLFYNFQVAVEDIHTLTYENLLNTLITDQEELVYFKNAVSRIPVVKQKAEWATKYIDDNESSFPIRLIAFAILEGIFFSGSFCAIFWIDTKNVMKGLVQSNKSISFDEYQHYNFALTLFRLIREDSEYEFIARDETIINMIREAVTIETQFINESIPCDMIGMNPRLMKEYIEYIADTLLRDIDMQPIYNTENPFDFMSNLGLIEKVNFFEVRNSIYQKASAGNLEYNSDDDDF